MPDDSTVKSFWNAGTKRGVLVMVATMGSLKIIDTLVQDGGVLAPSWKWPLIAAVCGGLYGSIISAYQAGKSSSRIGTGDS